MDPISVILSALVTAGAKVGGDAVSDAYAGLKRLIVNRFGAANPRLEQHIDDYVDDEETYAAPARKAIKESGAAEDQEVLDLAVEALKRAEAAQPGVTGGLVGQINAQGGNVVVSDTIHGGVHFNG
jgi:hypothetical protein